jgi:hypothetical protein
VWSEVFFVGKGVSGDLSVSGQVFADNLPQPKDFTLMIAVNVTETEMSLDDLTALPEPPDSDH